MTTISWGQKVEPAFITRLLKMTDGFKWERQRASDLMGCIAFESGRTFSADIKNQAGSGAVGLIQFMPATAVYLGTSTLELSRMTAVEQLDYVEKYFKPYAKRVKNLPDMYMAILMPKYVGQPDDTVIFRDATIAYRQNSGLDLNKDGVITKKEAAAKVQAMYELGLKYAISV